MTKMDETPRLAIRSTHTHIYTWTEWKVGKIALETRLSFRGRAYRRRHWRDRSTLSAWKRSGGWNSRHGGVGRVPFLKKEPSKGTVYAVVSTSLKISLSLSLLLSPTRFNGFPCGVYTSSARCLLAIVRRLSPPSRRKNEIRNGIKGWVGGKKVGGWRLVAGAGRGDLSLLSHVRAWLHNESEVVETGSREEEKKKEKKNVTCARRLLVYRASHFYRRTPPLSRLLYLVYRTLLGLTGISVPR